MRPPSLLSIALALAACATADPFAGMRIRKLSPMEGADARARLEIVPVPGLDGPTGDELWVLHRTGRYTRWRGCQDASIWTDSVNMSLGRPEIDTAWEPHLVVHELASWLVPEPIARRAASAGQGALRACGMVWRIEP